MGARGGESEKECGRLLVKKEVRMGAGFWEGKEGWGRGVGRERKNEGLRW